MGRLPIHLIYITFCVLMVLGHAHQTIYTIGLLKILDENIVFSAGKSYLAGCMDQRKNKLICAPLAESYKKTIKKSIGQ